MSFIATVHCRNGMSVGDDGGDRLDSEYACFRVPMHLHQQHWTNILSKRSELTDQLVLLQQQNASALQQIAVTLAKLEQPQFMHVYVSSDETGPASTMVETSQACNRTLLFELPRFGLEFQMRGSSLVSLDYAGYQLSPCQQLVKLTGISGKSNDYTLAGFQQYLILLRNPEHSIISSHGNRRADRLVLVPSGPVVPDFKNLREAKVQLSASSGTAIKVNAIEVHGRFGDLRATSIPARLQLAEIYAATGTLLPEPSSRMVGGHMAMRLLRQCWTNRPLLEGELAQLGRVCRLGGHLVPGLWMLARELQLSAFQLSFLYPGADSAKAPDPDDPLFEDACILYQQQSKGIGGWQANTRGLLSHQEEWRLLGKHSEVSKQGPPLWMRQMHATGDGLIDIDSCPVKDDVISQTEQLISSWVTESTPPDADCLPPYPLALASAGKQAPLPLEQAMHDELRSSWEAFHSASAPSRLRLPPGKLLPAIRQAQASFAQVPAHLPLLLIVFRLRQALSCFVKIYYSVDNFECSFSCQ